MNNIPEELIMSKRGLFSLIFVSIVVSSLFSGKADGGELIIFDKGNVNAVILTGKAPTPVAKFAAEELQSYLSRATDSSFEIKEEKEKQDKRISIYVGESEGTRTLGISIDNLPRDAFIIKAVSPDNIVILGKDNPKENPKIRTSYGRYERATLFGVYEFLERFVGVRWYLPGKFGEIVPEIKRLTLPTTLDIIEKPAMKKRFANFGKGRMGYGVERWKDLSEHCLYMYRLRFETDYIPFNHMPPRLSYAERFGKDHPEYFALKPDGTRDTNPEQEHPGRLCYTNPDVTRITAEDAIAFFSGVSAKELGIGMKRFGGAWDWNVCYGDYFCIMPSDSYQGCLCPNCQKRVSPRTKYSEIIWDYAAKVAKIVGEKCPGKFITLLAYNPWVQIPETVDIPDNLVVGLATTGPYSEYNPERQKREIERLQKWFKKCGHKVYLWNYANLTGYLDRMPGVPANTPHAVASFYKKTKNLIDGAFLETDTKYFPFEHLTICVFGKMMWNPDINIEELLDEYYEKMYGPGKKPMKELFEILENTFGKKVLGKEIDTPLGPSFTTPNPREIWEEIYTSSLFKRLELYFTQAEELASHSPAHLERIKYMHQVFMGEMERGYNLYLGPLREAKKINIIVKKTDTPITIDGRLNEKSWEKAEKVNMVISSDNEQLRKEKPAVETGVKVLWDDKNMYIAYVCQEPNPKRMRCITNKNDDKEIWMDDSVELFLDPKHTHQDYYQILINSKGFFTDIYYPNIGVSYYKWDSKIRVKTSVGKDSWIVEMAIPFTAFPGKVPIDDTVWGVNFNRGRHLKDPGPGEDQLYTWSPLVQGYFHQPTMFGHLIFRE